ncbi:MAG: PAS domain-containing protein [Myxococcales bacterium]|nr:PAS domain-containing protein [Myxococcales bacterium]
MARPPLGSGVEGILGVDSRGRVVVANAACAEIFGYVPGEVLGKPARVLLPDSPWAEPPGERAGLEAPRERAVLQPPRRRSIRHGLRLVGRRKDGSAVPVEISLCPVVVGAERCAIGLVVDTAARTLLEEQVAAAQRLEAVGQLAGSVAHDFINM